MILLVILKILTCFNFIIKGKILFSDVVFYYKYHKNTKVLENFNLSINPGERIALVG